MTGRKRVLRAFAFCLSLIAIAVQATVQLGLPRMVARAGDGSDIYTIVICTGHGWKTVQIDKDGKPLEEVPAARGKTKCPICTELQTASACTLAPVIALSAPLNSGRAVLGIPPQIRPVSRPYSSYVSRAPPALSFAMPV